MNFFLHSVHCRICFALETNIGSFFRKPMLSVKHTRTYLTSKVWEKSFLSLILPGKGGFRKKPMKKTTTKTITFTRNSYRFLYSIEIENCSFIIIIPNDITLIYSSDDNDDDDKCEKSRFIFLSVYYYFYYHKFIKLIEFVFSVFVFGYQK